MTEENNGKYICKATTSEGPLETSAYLAVEPAKRKRKDLHPSPAPSKANNKVFAVGNILAKENDDKLSKSDPISSTVSANEQRRMRHLKRQQLRRRRIARRHKLQKKLQEKNPHKVFDILLSHKKHNGHNKKEEYIRYDVKDPDHRPNSVFGSWFAS